MTDTSRETISHAQVHKVWSQKMLAHFREMSRQQKLAAVKAGDLVHWTPEDRAKALDLLAAAGPTRKAKTNPARPTFEPARKALPTLNLRPTKFDTILLLSIGGWFIFLILSWISTLNGFDRFISSGA